MDTELNESVQVDDPQKEMKKRKKRKKKIIINVKKKVPKKNITINENVISDATEIENSVNKEILDISKDSTINVSRSSTINASRSSTIDIPQTSISSSKTNNKTNTKKGNRTPKDNQTANFFGKEYNTKEVNKKIKQHTIIVLLIHIRSNI
ncbi:hypothetical protein YYG_01104 [Plasmodium vinckei petteri]|uniref:Uncharacterized protein n=1 Tax=Plasmodium vinckei petteri TaxID=138298 RepID=W7AQ99_PLAVN|nr:hypothetical protein YYG_01104 [Plasmodium vinckei petteri]